jgi:NTE family protein
MHYRKRQWRKGRTVTILAALVAGAVFSPGSEAKEAQPANSDPRNSTKECAGACPLELLSPPTEIIKGSTVEKNAGAHPKVVLALGGGACKSIAQIGVLKSLEKHHIPIDYIVGTSMGATIGSLYCAGYTPGQIEELFLKGKIQNAENSVVLLDTVALPVRKVIWRCKGFPGGGVTTGDKFGRFMARQLPERFDDLKIPFAAVATDLTTGVTSVLTGGNLPKAVQASSTLPGAFRPVLIDGNLFVDGGLKANLPTKAARRLGADIVVAVVCDKPIKTKSNKNFNSIKGVVARTTDIMLADADFKEARKSDVVIYPNTDNIPMMTKSRTIILDGITAGETAADEALAKIGDRLASYSAARSLFSTTSPTK